MWREQRCACELRGHGDSVTCVRAWTDEMLLSASYDATVRPGDACRHTAAWGGVGGGHGTRAMARGEAEGEAEWSVLTPLTPLAGGAGHRLPTHSSNTTIDHRP